MGIRLYDEALVQKIQNWVKDPNLQILKPDEATRFFEMTLDQKRDAPIHLPLISINRDRNIEIQNVQKQPRTFSGFNQSTKEEVMIPADIIPINISYQIDIYTKGMVEADEYIRNFVFNFINYPRLTINIPYNNFNVEHVADIHLDPNIADNSDIKEHLFADEFVRFTLKINIDHAYLFSLPKNEPAKWDEPYPFYFEVKDRYTKEIVEKDNIEIK